MEADALLIAGRQLAAIVDNEQAALTGPGAGTKLVTLLPGVDKIASSAVVDVGAGPDRRLARRPVGVGIPIAVVDLPVGLSPRYGGENEYDCHSNDQVPHACPHGGLPPVLH